MPSAEEHARRHAEALRKDREKAARALAKEAAQAERDRERAVRDAEKAAREREKVARAAQKEADRLRAEQDRAVLEVEREADQAEREAQRAALDAVVAAQRAARQVERARLRAAALEEGAGARSADGVAGERADAALPPALAVLWRPAPAGRRGPRPGLTPAGIAAAAVALADEEGLAGVSMARVAERLGVTTMALYRYVPGKDALLGLMLDTALGEAVEAAGAGSPGVPAAASGEPAWRTALERWCHDQLALAHLHPWAMEPAVTSSAPGPARVAFIDRGLRALDGTPLTWAERAAVVGRLSLHVLSEGQIVAAGVQAARAAAGDGAAAPPHPALQDFGTLLRAVVDPDRHPVLAEAVAAGAFDESSAEPGEGDDPDLGLRMVLDGVAALVERAGRRR